MATTGVTPPVTNPVTPAAISPGINQATSALDTQALVAAFAFGIAINGASAAAFLMFRGKTTSLSKDGQRLVLTIFLLSAALWAGIDFIATAIDPSSPSNCQVAAVIAAAFDQIARTALLQYFLWATAAVAKTAAQRFVPQGLLLVRFIIGAVWVGMQRPQFKPACVTTTEILPISITTIIVDAVVFAVCLLRLFSTGGLRDAKDDARSEEKAQGVTLTMAGYGIWLAASIPMHLGITGIPLILRTALPAAALAILVAIIAAFCGVLSLNNSRPFSRPPEAPSPTRQSATRDLPSRSLSSSSSEYPPSRYEDVKRGEIISISAFPTPPSREGPDSGNSPVAQNTLPTIDQPVIGQAITGVGGFPVQGQLFPPMRAEATPPPPPPVQQLKPSEGRANSVRPKKNLFDLGKGPGGGVAAAKLAISGPILQNRADEQNPLNKIATVDLATAAKNERERRDQNMLQRDSSLIAKRPAPQPPAITPEEAMKRSQSVKRKEIASNTPPADEVSGGRLSVEDVAPTAMTTSAQLSPGVEEIRRRSPRLVPQPTPQEPAQLQQPTRELEDPRPAPPKPGQMKPEPAKIIPQRPPRPESLGIDVAPAPPKAFRPIAPAPPRFSPEAVPKPVQRSQSPPRFPWEEEDRRRSPDAAASTQPVQPQAASRSPPPRLPSPPQTQAEYLPRAFSPEKMSSPPRMQSPPQVGRRSPPTGVGTGAIPKPPPSPPSQEPSKAQKVDSRMSILPRKTSVKTDIRPSRQRPPSVEDLPSPEKPAIQRMVAAGLPGNPRAMAMKTLMNEAENKRVQTVMFVNNIEYNDPVAVRNILQGAADKVAAKNAAAEANEETTSVLHRPRPIPRTRNAQEDQGIPSPTSPMLQRTKSGATAERKKSILRSNPGSPTQLPPLPPAPMPKRPGNPIRPLPNDTKSMTFDEKMEMFFPVPPSRPGSSHSNSGAGKPTLSPIPTMPALPASFLEMDGESEKEKSDRTTKTSFQTQSIVEIADLKNRELNARNTAKFSVDTETTTGVSQAWLPPVPSMQGLPYPTQEGKKRQSSPVLPYIPDNASVFSDGKTQDYDDATTNWGSVHSPARAVNMRNAQQQGGPKKTYVSKKSDKEMMTIMLDDSNGARRDIAERESWLADGQRAMNTPPKDLSDDSKRESRWHRRVGDECPTFSDRKEKTRSRKMVPPTPLLLRGVGNKNMVVIRAAEPSPLESPSEAYRDIQSKLKKLDDANRDSVGSEGRKQALLDNLEQEMGQQESYWLGRQDDINRDSMSTVRTSPRRDSVHEAASRAAARGQAAAKRGSLLKPAEVARVPLSSPTPPDTDESDDDALDKRMQASKMLDQPKEKKPAPARLWTRAPFVAVGRNTIVHLLWAPVRPAPKEHNTPTSSVMTDMTTSSIPRKASKRSLTSQPLPKIESTSLWQKPKKAHSSSSRLWGSTAPMPKAQKAPNRPTTQRPARRSRRVTMLPDILESPQPLPDNHGTLGIFQFPWGEKSDTATLNSRPSHMFMAMPGTMSTGGPAIAAALEARSRQLESQEYSSSFFDDYEEDLPGDVDPDFDMDGSDDDFDETTLWEIASLLKTDKIPSKDSLLPASGVRNKPREATSVLGDYMDDADADSDGRKDSIIVGLDLNSGMRPKAPIQRALTWVAPARLRSWEEPSGLFSLEHKRTDYRTTSKEPAAIHMERKSRVSHDPLPALASSTLWTAENNRNSAPETATRNWLMADKAAAVHEPLRRQHGPIAADKANWETALNEALEKSYPEKVVMKTKAHKPVAASEEEWNSALEEAISLGGWQNIAQVEQPVLFEQERQMPQEQWQPAPAQQENAAWVEPVVAGYQEYFQPAIPEPTPAPVREEPVVREPAPAAWVEPIVVEPAAAPVWVEPVVPEPAPAPVWIEPVVAEPAPGPVWAEPTVPKPAPSPVWVEPVVAGYQEQQWVEPVVAGYQEYFQPAIPEPAPAPAWEMPVVPGYLEQWGLPARQPSPMRIPQPSPRQAPEPSSFLMPEPPMPAPSPRSPARLPSLQISSTDLWQNPSNNEPQPLPATTTDLWSEGAVNNGVGEPIAVEMTPPNSSRPRPSPETEEALPVFASQQMWQREEVMEPQAGNWLDTMVVNQQQQQQQQQQEEVRGVVFRY